MEFFRIRRDIPFMRHALVFNVISLVTFLLAVGSLATKGLHFGVDFTGGTVMEVSYDEPPELNRIRETIAGLGLTDVAVQNFGTARDVLIRLPAREDLGGAKVSESVMEALRKVEPSVQLRRVEFVGPQVGKELVENGALALLFVSIGIVLYLWMRFEWKFGLSGIVANLHDVVIILGFFSFFQWEFSLPVLAAVLAILGYSVNESVVIFDRVRENFRKMRKAGTTEILDAAITQNISRTIITHGSTQIMALTMLFFGGPALHYFAVALTIGICFGIYSSVFVAAALLMWLKVSRAHFIKPPRRTGRDEHEGAVV